MFPRFALPSNTFVDSSESPTVLSLAGAFDLKFMLFMISAIDVRLVC